MEMATTTTLPSAARVALAPQTRSPSRRTLGNFAASAAVTCVQLVAQWLPERELLRGAKVLGYFFYYVARFRRAVVEKRLAVVFPHVAATERAAIARDAYVHLALTLLWFLRLPSLALALGDDHAAENVTEKLIDCGDSVFCDFQVKVFDAKRNAIIMTGHVGMWELLPAALSRPLSHQWIVYRPLHQPALDRIVNRIRQAPQRQLVPDKNCFALLRDELLRPSSTTQLVGLVADHRASNPVTGAQVNFLGQRTCFPTGAARLYLSGSGNSSSSPASTLWFTALLHNREFYESPANLSLKPFKLTIRQVGAQELQTTGEDSQQLQVASITHSYATILEEIILKHPEQYLWMHDQWNHKKSFVMDVS